MAWQWRMRRWQTRPCMTTTRQSIAKWKQSCKQNYLTCIDGKVRITTFLLRCLALASWTCSSPFRLLLMPGKAWRKSSLIGSSFLFVALMASTMEILVTEDSSSTCDGRGRLVIIKFAHLFITKLRKGRGQPRSAIQVKLKQVCRNTIWLTLW